MHTRLGTLAVGIIVGTVLCFACPTQVQAGWMMSHGSSGQVTVPGDWEESYAWGNGLNGCVKAGKTTFVVIPIPAPGDKALPLKKFRVVFTTGGHITITRIQIWDGGALVREINGSWTGSQSLTFTPTFSTPYKIKRGLALTLQIVANNAGTSHSRLFQLMGASALFAP